MVMTPEEIDALPTYSARQQLKLWQRASIELATAGVSYAISGRSLTRNNASEVAKMLDYWQEQVAIEDAEGGGNVLVTIK